MSRLSPEVVESVLRAAEWRCEECDVPDTALGYWHQGEWRPVEERESTLASRMLRDWRGPDAELARVKLTVRHNDLRALCQHCQRRLDRAERRREVGA